MATKRVAPSGANRTGLVVGIAVVAVVVVAGGAYLLMAGEEDSKPVPIPGPQRAAPMPGEMSNLAGDTSRRASDERREPRVRENRRPERRPPAARSGGGGSTQGSKGAPKPKKRRPSGKPGIL